MFDFIDKHSDLDTVNYISKSMNAEILEKALDRTKLVPKIIFDKNGRKKTVLINPNKDKKADKVHVKQEEKKDIHIKFHAYKAQEQTKQSVMNATKGMKPSEVFEFVKSHGVAWDENAHEPINVMRAKSALFEAIEKHGIKLHDKNDAKKADSDVKLTAKKTESSKANGDVKAVKQKKAPAESTTQIPSDMNMSGLFGDEDVSGTPINDEAVKKIYNQLHQTKTKYEEENFGNIIKSASDDEIFKYRTLGMCGEDEESSEYLSRLYTKYTKAMSSNNKDNKLKFDTEEALRGNVPVAMTSVVKGISGDILKKVSSQDKYALELLLNPATDPNKEIDESTKFALKKMPSQVLEKYRTKLQTEVDNSHEFTRKILDKFELSPTYKDLAVEYKSILDEMSELEKLHPSILDLCSLANIKFFEEGHRDKNYNKSPDEWKDYKNHKDVPEFINSGDTGMGVRSYLRWKYRNQLYHVREDWDDGIPLKDDKNTDKRHLFSKSTSIVQSAINSHLKLNEKISSLQDENFHFVTKDEAKKAIELQKKLLDPKFTDLNANLAIYKKLATHLSAKYSIQKDFVKDMPVFSHKDLEMLSEKDPKAVSELAIHMATFVPSKTKNISDKELKANIKSNAQANLEQLFEEYGAVKASSLLNNYSEDNEIRCKISKAPEHIANAIKNNIKNDWDMKNHQNIKYRIKGVYQINGLQVEGDFNKIRERNKKFASKSSLGKNCQVDTFYHGTGSVATSLILGHSGQFKVGNAKVGRMLGDGVYLANKSSKSAQYIDDSGYKRHGAKGSLMICEATLGKTICKLSSHVHNCDSVCAGESEGLLNKEWCVKNPQAIIPRYLVEMETI